MRKPEVSAVILIQTYFNIVYRPFNIYCYLTRQRTESQIQKAIKIRSKKHMILYVLKRRFIRTTDLNAWVVMCWLPILGARHMTNQRSGCAEVRRSHYIERVRVCLAGRSLSRVGGVELCYSGEAAALVLHDASLKRGAGSSVALRRRSAAVAASLHHNRARCLCRARALCSASVLHRRSLLLFEQLLLLTLLDNTLVVLCS